MSEIILTDENFNQEVSKVGKPVLVDFFAPWCPPCSVLGPLLEKIAKDYQEKFIFVKVNLDESPLIANKYEIVNIPTVILFKNGQPQSGFIGLRSEEIIKEWLDKNI